MTVVQRDENWVASTVARLGVRWGALTVDRTADSMAAQKAVLLALPTVVHWVAWSATQLEQC